MKVNFICLKIFIQKRYLRNQRVFSTPNLSVLSCFPFPLLFFHGEKLKHTENNSVSGGEILSSVDQMLLIRSLSFPFSPLASCHTCGSAMQLAKFNIIHTEVQGLGLICYSSPIQALLRCGGKSQVSFLSGAQWKVRQIFTKQSHPFHYHSWTSELCHVPILIALQ